MKRRVYGLFAMSLLFFSGGIIWILNDRSASVSMPFFVSGILGIFVTLLLNQVVGRIEQLERALAERGVEADRTEKKGTS